MATNGARGILQPFPRARLSYQLTTTIASSVASSSETSLVGASGYKVKKDEPKSGKVKLKKLPAVKRKNLDVNGMPARVFLVDLMLRHAVKEPKMTRAPLVLHLPSCQRWMRIPWPHFLLASPAKIDSRR